MRYYGPGDKGIAMKKNLLLLISALIWLWSPVPVEARPQTLQVPSDRFPTIQSAINFAAAGDRIVIAPGVYNETLTIAKRITLTGSGARGERLTAIVGPRPTEVVPIERAIGVVTYQPGGGGKIESLLIRGGDGAGILGVAIEGRFPAALEVKQVIIHQGVRGIAGSFTDLSVQDSKIADMLWHGVSIVKAKGHISFGDNFVAHCMGLGYFSPGGDVSLTNDNFSANSQGGILVNGAGAGFVKVTKCFMYGNNYAGIRLVNVDGVELSHNLIKLTLPKKDDERFGDGIVVECSENVSVFQDPANSVMNFALDFLPPGIEDSARAGISNFSSPVKLTNVKFECNLFHLGAEDTPDICSSTNTWSFDDFGGNQCGCDLTPVTCQVTSPGLEPPDPIPPTN
jgi:hypothetical protein